MGQKDTRGTQAVVAQTQGDDRLSSPQHRAAAERLIGRQPAVSRKMSVADSLHTEMR